jgi:hypothetical protein
VNDKSKLEAVDLLLNQKLENLEEAIKIAGREISNADNQA